MTSCKHPLFQQGGQKRASRKKWAKCVTGRTNNHQSKCRLVDEGSARSKHVCFRMGHMFVLVLLLHAENITHFLGSSAILLPWHESHTHKWRNTLGNTHTFSLVQDKFSRDRLYFKAPNSDIKNIELCNSSKLLYRKITQKDLNCTILIVYFYFRGNH